MRDLTSFLTDNFMYYLTLKKADGILNTPASMGMNVHSNELKLTNLNDILENIKSNTQLEELTRAVRAVEDQDERRALKAKTLPYFNLGTFSQNIRQSSNLISTEFMLFDLDHLGNRIDQVRAKLKEDPHVISFFTSPSGDGLKVIYRLDKAVTDPKVYSKLYRQYADFIKQSYGIEPDTTSDAARPCFFSYDPELYLKIQAQPLTTEVCNADAEKPAKIQAVNFRKLQMEIHLSAVKFLSTQKISYSEWIECGFAIAEEYGAIGESLFLTLSKNPNFKDTDEEIRAKYNELLQNSREQISIQTLLHIASKYGYSVPAEVYERNVLTAELQDEADSFTEELKRRFKLDDERDPNVLLGFPLTKFRELARYIDGVQPGFYLLGAESNVGKTAVLTNLCLDAMDTNPEVRVIYFSLDDSRFYTIYRFLSILTGFHINDLRKQQNDPVQKLQLDEKREVILSLIESGRLIIKDIEKVQHVKDLEKGDKEYRG